MTRNTSNIVVPDAPENNACWIPAMNERAASAVANLAEQASPFPLASGADGQAGPAWLFDTFAVDAMPHACGLSCQA